MSRRLGLGTNRRPAAWLLLILSGTLGWLWTCSTARCWRCWRFPFALEVRPKRLSSTGLHAAVSLTESQAPPVAVREEGDLMKAPDLSERPWEALSDVYQIEAMRCWAERADGKVRGFIANLLPDAAAEEAQMSPFEIANLRRQWRVKEEDEEERQEKIVADPYKTLGLPRNATSAEIKKAYLKMARANHPDMKDGDPEKFQDVLLAYRILKDDSRRGHFEETGRDTGDVEQAAQKIRVPELQELRQGLLEHEDLCLAPGHELLAGQVGTVQFDYPERLLIQAVFDLGEDGEMAAWLPRQILSIVGEDGSEVPISDDRFQQAGLMLRSRENKLMKIEKSKRLQNQALREYVDGWRGLPPGMKEIGHVQAFFMGGKELDGGVVLDLGCGDGEASHLFTQKGSFNVVFGLDNNKTALFQAREGAEMEGLGPLQGLYLIRADARELPLREQQVDHVWWGYGWNAMDKPAEVLREAFRVLKSGGKLAIATNDGLRLALEIQKALEEAGFENLSIYPPRYGVFLNYASKPHA